MAYSLTAFIGAPGVLDLITRRFLNTGIVTLTESLALLPLTSALMAEIERVEPTDQALAPYFFYLRSSLQKVAVEASKGGLLAYVEAEFFGGYGGQSVLIWRDGQLMWGPYSTDEDHYAPPPLSEPSPISQALRLLGVQAAPGKDEFDTVGLGRVRHTDRWIG